MTLLDRLRFWRIADRANPTPWHAVKTSAGVSLSLSPPLPGDTPADPFGPETFDDIEEDCP